MAINKSDKIRALRNGLTISAITTFSTALPNSNAQSPTLSETKTKHIAAVPKHDGEDDLSTLSPEDFLVFNPTEHETTIQDFKKITHLTDFSDDFPKNPEAYGKSDKLIFGKYMLIAKNNIEEASTFFFDFKKEELAQLSEQDYKSICATQKHTRNDKIKPDILQIPPRPLYADFLPPEYIKQSTFFNIL